MTKRAKSVVIIEFLPVAAVFGFGYSCGHPVLSDLCWLYTKVHDINMLACFFIFVCVCGVNVVVLLCVCVFS